MVSEVFGIFLIRRLNSPVSHSNNQMCGGGDRTPVASIFVMLAHIPPSNFKSLGQFGTFDIIGQ